MELSCDSARTAGARLQAHVSSVLERAEAARDDASKLLALLAELNPQRRSVCGVASGGRIPISRAPAELLLHALKVDAEAAVHHMEPARSAFKEAERTMRVAARGGVASCVAAGALDAGALDMDALFAIDDTSSCNWAVAVALPQSTESSVLPGGLIALRSLPGVYLAPRALPEAAQEHWAMRVLTDFVEPPNRRNIDGHIDPDVSTLRKYGKSTLAPSLRESSTAVSIPLPGELRRGLWPEWRQWRRQQLDSSFRSSGEGGRGSTDSVPALAAVSWATCGLQYDWTTRSYHLPGDADYGEHARGSRWEAPFPPDLRAWAASMADAVDAAVRAAGIGGDDGGSAAATAAHGLPMRLHAQAGICNLYDASRRSLPMGGHVDDMERDLRFPVVSASVGCAAVFLVGGNSKEVPPAALLLRSGDVLLLSGASRLAWHGVAAILPGTCPPGLFAPPPRAADGEDAGSNCHGSTEREDFRAFVETHRINFNLRQVEDEETTPSLGGREARD